MPRATVRFSELLAANGLLALWIEEQCQTIAHFSDDAFGCPGDDLGVACRPVEALDLVCKDHSSDGKTIRESDLERIALGPVRDGTEQGKVHL
jgi:hypothetical protein